MHAVSSDEIHNSQNEHVHNIRIIHTSWHNEAPQDQHQPNSLKQQTLITNVLNVNISVC